jgi:hypothetical protein
MKITKQKKLFCQSMKWNKDCNKKLNKVKSIPIVTCGAFGQCKYKSKKGKK